MQNVALFQNFADSCLKNDPIVLYFANSHLTLKKYPKFFAKIGTNMVYTLIGSGGSGGGVGVGDGGVGWIVGVGVPSDLG